MPDIDKHRERREKSAQHREAAHARHHSRSKNLLRRGKETIVDAAMFLFWDGPRMVGGGLYHLSRELVRWWVP